MNERIANRKAFVGRAGPLDELNGMLIETVRGNGGAAVITGEAGVGKTTLVMHLADRAETLGIDVVWGSCWPEGGSPAMWPWVQILSSMFAGVDCGEAVEMAGADGAELVEVVPSLGECLGRLAGRTHRMDPLGAVSQLCTP